MAKSKKWEKEAFMRAFYAESGTKHFKGKDEEKNWNSFFGAMAKHCKTAGAGELDAIRLMMYVEPLTNSWRMRSLLSGLFQRDRRAHHPNRRS